ncbi:MAG: SAM-dependent methyltransferase [Muribaculaceae bacterium]|nr:SAM-dependent methyltransferase [Muribaculaceae bacterium]
MREFVASLRGIDFTKANSLIHSASGIVDFFDSNEDKESFISSYESDSDIACEEKSTYGDWQTPYPLALRVCQNYLLKFGQPDVVIEPTCGLGSFVRACLVAFPDIKSIYAIEINKEYVNNLKVRLLADALVSPKPSKPDIHIANADFFNFDFSFIAERCIANNYKVGLIGNPPWVTNSHQGRKGSSNLPQKSNQYHLTGLDALTGKSNFDISEFIALSLLKTFDGCKGAVSFLLKNSVIRNIVNKQIINGYLLSDVRQEKIDAAKEFDVSVDASCLSASLGDTPSNQCDIVDFYTQRYISTYGWAGDRFSSDIAAYEKYSQFDGKSTFIWRSGIKHDCATVLELTYQDGRYKNGLNEYVDIEGEYIYPLLKSSDTKKECTEYRRFVIVPQRRIGQDTSQLGKSAPRLFAYLMNHADAFDKRKSSIYKGKDRFSIFGIGDYSFKPFKIVVSSLYKNIDFKLLKEYDGVPVMVDDTCYQLDFDTIEEATVILEALQSDEIRSLLRSLVFTDSKRVVTKNLLMRLDLAGWCKSKGLSTNSDRRCQQLSLFD